MAGFSAMGHAQTLTADRITLPAPIPGSATLTRVNFRQSYPGTPLVFVLPTADNPDPSLLRIVNVTTTGFDVGRFEPQGEDGAAPGGQIDYIAISPGIHLLPGGVVLEAGVVNISNHQGRNVPGAGWSTLSFVTAFAGPPAVLTQVQSNNNGTLVPGAVASPWLSVALSNLTSTNVLIALERAETSTGSVAAPETVAYLAVNNSISGTFTDNSANTIGYEAQLTSDSITGWDNGCQLFPFTTTYPDPIVAAGQSTRDGADGGWLRRCALSGANVGFAVDEDQASDSERGHITERAGILVVSEPFDASLAVGGWEADHVVLSGASPATLSFVTVNFPEALSATPLVFTQPTENGTDPVSIAIRSVTASSFQVAAVEPAGNNGAHESQTIDYIAVVPGLYTLPDGTLLEGRFVDTTQVQSGPGVGGPTGWETVNFASSFLNPPAFVAQLQTTANNDPAPDPSFPFSPWLTVAVSNLTASTVQVALDRSEVNSGSVVSQERIGMLAMTAAQHGTFADKYANAIEYDTRQATNAIQGFDNGCNAVAFTAPFATAPIAVGHGNSRNGNNGGWARRCGITGSTLSQHFDEDQFNDTERAHINESVGQIAFSVSFVWAAGADIDLTPSLQTIDDGISVSQAKSIPGAIIEVTLLARNRGSSPTDTDSVEVVWPIDPDTELFVGDLDGGGNPVVFTDGTVPDQSGLGWTTPASKISFSDDGGVTFTYVPSGAVQFDPAITHLKIEPDGTFLAQTLTGNPQFTATYQVRVR